MSRQQQLNEEAAARRNANCGPQRGCRASCCEDLLAQLGVADPGDADFYEVLQRIIGDDEADVDVDVDIPTPANTVFVSPSWGSPDFPDGESYFISLQAAIDFAGALATAAAPWTVYVYAGTYPAVTLPANVNLIGVDDSSVFIGGLSAVSLATDVGASVPRIANVTITGALTVDTSARTDLAGVQYEFDNITTGLASVIDLTLRSSVAGGALTVRDQIAFRRSEVNGASLTFDVPAPVVGPGVLVFDDSFLTLSGALTITGAVLPPPALGVARTTPGRRVVPRGRNGHRFSNLLPAAPTISAAFLFFGPLLQAASASITNSNTLIADAVVDTNVTGTDAVYTVTGGVYNNSNSTYTEDALVVLAAGTVGSFVNSQIDEANLSGAGAADRTQASGTVAASALTDPTRFGAVIAFAPAFVNNTYNLVGSVVSGTAVTTPVAPTLQVKTVAAAELALSSAALPGSTIAWTALQSANLIPFI